MTHECGRQIDRRTDFVITNAALHYVARLKIWIAEGEGVVRARWERSMVEML